MLFATPNFAGFIITADELACQDVNFTWSDVTPKRSKSSPEYSLFVTVYHVIKFCLAVKKRGSSALPTVVDCSNPKNLIGYRAYNGEDQFGIEIVSYLSETESASGKDRQTQTPRLYNRQAPWHEQSAVFATGGYAITKNR